MKSFKEEIKNAIIEATASDRIVSFKVIANEYGHSHMKNRDVEDIKAAVLKAVPDFRAVMMYDSAEQMAHPERQSLFCGLHFVENGVEFETWSVHFPTPAKSSAKENSYEWKRLMRKTKEQLLAEAQRLGSTVDSLTTRSKADLADYVIWLADREKTLTEEESSSALVIESAEPCYTGGGIYVYRGKLTNGNWFIADDDYNVYIVDAPVDWDESFYVEWMEDHRVEDLSSADSLLFFKQMLGWIKANEPDGNYMMSDMDYIEEDLDECMAAEKSGETWK